MAIKRILKSNNSWTELQWKPVITRSSGSINQTRDISVLTDITRYVSSLSPLLNWACLQSALYACQIENLKYFLHKEAFSMGDLITDNLFQLFTSQSQLLTTLKKKPFENIVGKGENAVNQHFLLFPQCFLPFSKYISFFKPHFLLLSANAFNLKWPKIFLFGKKLDKFHLNLIYSSLFSFPLIKKL